MSEKINVLIVGGGRGGKSFVDLFSTSTIVKILAVIDINMDAPGITLARELGIPVDDDYRKYVNRPELNEIINVTGSDKIQEELLANKPAQVSVIDGYSAKFIWRFIEEHLKMEES